MEALELQEELLLQTWLQLQSVFLEDEGASNKKLTNSCQYVKFNLLSFSPPF